VRPKWGKKVKVYTSKNGNKFRICDVARPRDGEVVYITREIFDWLKTQNVGADEFTLVWKLIYDDYRYSPIPEEEKSEAAKLADKYGTQIIESLKGRSENGNRPEGDSHDKGELQERKTTGQSERSSV
jgi:hypothetical protein